MEESADVIRSAENRNLKFIRSLRQRNVREAERAFLVEGDRAVLDALHAGGRPRVLLIRADADPLPELAGASAPLRRVAPALFNQIAETKHPQPLLAVFDIPEIPVNPGRTPLFVVADGIQDPGNLGTLLRSAAAVDATAVLTTPGTVDPFNGKVVRAAMGAHFRVPLTEIDEEWRRRLIADCPLRALAEAGGTMLYDELDWTGPAVLIVGSEAHGPSETGRALASQRVRIPLLNGVESLNAGVAGAIMLFEAARQRRLSGSR